MSVTMSGFYSGCRYVKNLFVKPSQTAPSAMESQHRALQQVDTSSSAFNATRSRTPAESLVNENLDFYFEINPAAAKLEISAPQLVITTSKHALDTKLEFIKYQQDEAMRLVEYLASLGDKSDELMKKQDQQERDLKTLNVFFQVTALDEVDGLKGPVKEKIPIQRKPSRKISSETKDTVSFTQETQNLANQFCAAILKERELPESQFSFFQEYLMQSIRALLNIANIAIARETTQDLQVKLAKQKEKLALLKNELEIEKNVLVYKQIAFSHQEKQAKNQILTAQNPDQTLENTHSLDAIKKRLDSYNSEIETLRSQLNSWAETLRSQLALNKEQAINTSVAQPAIKANDQARSSRAGSNVASPILKASPHWETQPASGVSATLPAHSPNLRRIGSMPDIRLPSAQAQLGAGQGRSISKHKASQSVSFSRDQENERPFMQSIVHSSIAPNTSAHLDGQEQMLNTQPAPFNSINTSIDEFIGEVKLKGIKRRPSSSELNEFFNTDAVSFSANPHTGKKRVGRQTSSFDLRAAASAQPASMEEGNSMPYVAPLNIPPKSKLSTLPKGQERLLPSPISLTSEGQGTPLFSPISPTSENQEAPLPSPISSISRRTPVRSQRNSQRFSQGSSLGSISEHSGRMSPVVQAGRKSKEVTLQGYTSKI